MKLSELRTQYQPYDNARITANLKQELVLSANPVIVLDDDPTGTQTVHHLPVYTDWSRESIASGLAEESRTFFILTNSRAFTEEETAQAHREIGESLLANTKQFLLVSRGDSTLRGHYPLETQMLRDTMEAAGIAVDGEVLCPFFPEGGRYTAGNVHYVADGDDLVPAGETEFARDRTFGYQNSDLTRWIEEKTSGACPAPQIICITLEELRALDYEGITKKLCGVTSFEKVVVNALDYGDLMVFSTAFLRALRMGKRFLVRSAAALVKVLGGVADQPLLEREELRDSANPHGGLIIAGSHVKKTTAQLAELCKLEEIVPIEMNQHLVVDQPAFEEEVRRVIALADETIAAGRSAAVFTRRERFDLNTGNKEDELRCATLISDKLTGIVAHLRHRPAFLIAKGGITSSDIATRGLEIRRATVLGQILPGVPVWLTGEESRFPDLPYVIFPGNVGDEMALVTAVRKFLATGED